ncbi:MAG TPA: hypothetical protein VFN42_09855 [Acetobacteraceae bacterium]|nr:hypothetical protein [Acetobacteraceae bacterium]
MLLILVHALLVYARHWARLFGQAAERGIALLAHCCGSAQASFVLSHFTRGILRAIALQRVLSARAVGEPAGNAAGAASGMPRKRTPPAGRHSVSGASHDQLTALPTLRQLEAAISRRPVEDVIDDISRDLGAAFSLCDIRFGNALRDMAAAYRDTLRSFLHECRQREAAVADAPRRILPFALPPQKPGAIRYIVGCLGVQQPVCGFPFTAAPFGAAIAGAQPPGT